MKQFLKQKLAATTLCAGLCIASGTSAVVADDMKITVDGLLGVVTDYRENGVSLTGKDFAGLANVRFSTNNGLYADFFAVSMGDGELADAGDDLMLDGRVGYNWDGDVYSYGLSASLQTYHGGLDGSRYFPEVQGSIARDFGIFYIKGSMEYAFDGRWYTGGNDAFYTALDLELPIPRMPDLTLVTHVGYDMISGDIENPWDWKVGLSAFYKDVELTLMYQDSSLNTDNASGTVVFGLKWYF